ncbi:hypothetical protein [Lelliottia nimipressuralis]|uniref:Uncharacterized protein n=1 Tax=Lelliottia nimipressuralis TaxID=69220 RepID=A0ABD4KAV4_9ENTR|nr:hypothetical protein [Lelliottia nimipressuralis]MBF4179078.1 hypothetical protein [Lelliottia nimipressuralis]
MKNNEKQKSGIDAAFSRPLRPVYVVTRHGYRKRCLSRSAALNNLAHYMTTHAFQLVGVATHHPAIPVQRDGVTVYQLGQHTGGYLASHARCIHRLRRILARKRKVQKWHEKWDSMHERYVKERDELQACKPF